MWPRLQVFGELWCLNKNGLNETHTVAQANKSSDIILITPEEDVYYIESGLIVKTWTHRYNYNNYVIKLLSSYVTVTVVHGHVPIPIAQLFQIWAY